MLKYLRRNMDWRSNYDIKFALTPINPFNPAKGCLDGKPTFNLLKLNMV